MWKWSWPSTVLCDRRRMCVSVHEWIIYTYIFALICMCVYPCILSVNYIRIHRGAANVGQLQLSTLKKTILIPNSQHYSKSLVASTLACSYKIIFVRFLVHCYSAWQIAECSYARNCNPKRFMILSPVMCVTAWWCIGLWVLSNCLWANSNTVADTV